MNYILPLLFALIFFSNPVSAREKGINEQVYEIVIQAFPEANKEAIIIKELKGGLSGTALYKIDIQNKSYVLRFHHAENISNQDLREHFALIEAAKLGLSPAIVYISPDHKAILMEFIKERTLSIEKACQLETVSKIAKAIRKAHTIIGHTIEGESTLSKAHRCYPKVFEDALVPQENITKAYELVQHYGTKLATFDYPKVNLHGDLNPRNIFLSDQVLLIDWAESVLEDPFQDLAYFSLKMDYNEKNEHFLIGSYLERSPNSEELKRFELRKKLLHAFWSLTDLYLADCELKKHPESRINTDVSLKPWGEYQKAYAESVDLPAQYFYELSCLNLKLASEKPND